MADLTVKMFQTIPGSPEVGGGVMDLVQTKNGGYDASIDWRVAGVGNVVHRLDGNTETAGNGASVIRLRSGDGTVNVSLQRNPLESRVSYSGAVSISKGPLYVYNVVVAKAS